jgi:hypothetical protein
MVPVQELPNRLLRDGRAVLARYGYRHLEAMPDAGSFDWAALWDQLRGDFATQHHPVVPPLDALSGEAAEAARAYMVCGLDADLKLDRCEALHVRLFGEGIATGLVEEYAAARDAYEDAVEAFGAAGARLSRLLFSH